MLKEGGLFAHHHEQMGLDQTGMTKHIVWGGEGGCQALSDHL